MALTVKGSAVSEEVRSLDTVRPAMARAGLDRTSPSDAVGSPDSFGQVVKTAVRQHYGSVKAAAISLDVDPSQLTREFDQGKFASLEKADAEAKAAIATALTKAFGASDPKARLREELRQARAHLDRAYDLFTDVA